MKKTKQINMTKIKKALLPLLFCLPLLFSCNKSFDPIVIEGTWQIDTAYVNIAILYDDVAAAEHPTEFKFLTDHRNYFRNKLKNPITITFTKPNSSVFNYLDDRGIVEGSYTQQDMYFTVINPLFPQGIFGASDNQRLEIYYGKDYMLNLLYELIEPDEDTREIYNSIIRNFEGLGSYKR